jgi:hypothetical protein
VPGAGDKAWSKKYEKSDKRGESPDNVGFLYDPINSGQRAHHPPLKSIYFISYCTSASCKRKALYRHDVGMGIASLSRLMTKRIFSTIVASLVVLFFFCTPPSAVADPMAPGPTLYVNGVAVAFGSFSSFTGSVAGGWTINASMGMVTGTNGLPVMELFFSATSTGAGSLTISFAANSFGPTNTMMTGSFGGTVNPRGGTATFSARADSGNSHLSGTPLFGNQAFNTGAYSGTASGVLNLPFYALTQQVTIVHTAWGTTSGDFLLSPAAVPDGGSTICLLVVAIAGMGLFRRKLAKTLTPPVSIRPFQPRPFR